MKRHTNTNKLFALCVLLFLLHQILQHALGIKLPFIDSYLDPLLMMPVLLHLVVLERRMVFRRHAHRMPPDHILGYTILVALISEVAFPALSNLHTGHPLDVIVYAMGALVYAAAQRWASASSNE